MIDIEPNKRFVSSTILSAVIIAGSLYIAGQYVASEPQRIQQEAEANREITVNGNGKIVAKPDVARITLGLTTGPQQNAEQAISLLGKQFDDIVSTVAKQGVTEDDITTTDLSVNPEYDFSSGRQTLRGFTATESVRVTIRKLDTIGAIVAATTAAGINQVGGISFEIDDPDELQIQAEEAAIVDAQATAKRLAKSLDASLGPVKSFSASNGSLTPVPQYARAELATDKVTGPPVPAGTQDITSTVTIVYTLR